MNVHVVVIVKNTHMC